MSATQQNFKSALAQWPSGVSVVTSLGAVPGGTGPVGMTVSSFFSVSLEPLLVGVCLDNSSNTLGAIRAAGHFAVNILSAEQSELSNRFALKGNEATRFDDVPLVDVDAARSPLLAGATAHIDCAVHRLIEAGDHTICLGAPTWLAHYPPQPLVFQSWTYRTLADPAVQP